MIEAAKKSTETLKTRAELLRKAHSLLHTFRLDAEKLGTQLRDSQSPSGELIISLAEVAQDFALGIELEQDLLNRTMNQEFTTAPELVTA